MRYNNCMKGRVISVLCCALRIFDDATICIARVICAVLVMDRMRRRKSRVLAIYFALEAGRPRPAVIPFLLRREGTAPPTALYLAPRGRGVSNFHFQVCLNSSTA